jgi:hypothetical protein
LPAGDVAPVHLPGRGAATGEVHDVTTPYHYLLAGATAPSPDFIEELCIWHNRMVAHLRRYGAAPPACACPDADDCPRRQAVDLYRRAENTLGDVAGQLTFLRRHAQPSSSAPAERGDAHG